ncbi:MAG TPA: hypothetical protein GX739_07805 [Firmicutes bacterium]|nr:hypothetical protein [Bacillota bacterium]
MRTLCLRKVSLTSLMLLVLVGALLAGCESNGIAEESNPAAAAVDPPQVEWITGQVASDAIIGIEQTGAEVTLTMDASYGYAKIENVVIPQEAVQAKVTIVAVSAGQATGERNLWRLRMTTPEQVVINVGGGGAAIPGYVEYIELRDQFLALVQAGMPIPALELGGTWALGESVTFRLEFLDSDGNLLHYFSKK